MLEPAELAPAAWSGKQDSGPADGAALGGKCVLVAEDSPFFRDHVVAMLDREGATVLTAPDGQAAWELLEARGPEVDLVLTDIQMPRLDGLELTRRIRARSETAGLPVVMLTSLAAEEDYRRGSEAGATAYCIKLDSDQLVSTLRGLLGASGGGPPAQSGGVEQLALRLRAESEAGGAPAAPVCKGEAR
jgi:CheY-like chemotaxis protein